MGFFVEKEFYGDNEVRAVEIASGRASPYSAEQVMNGELMDAYMRYRFDDGMSPLEAVQQMGLSPADGFPENIADQFEHRALRIGRGRL